MNEEATTTEEPTDEQLVAMQRGLKGLWKGFNEFLGARNPRERRAAYENMKARADALDEILD